MWCKKKFGAMVWSSPHLTISAWFTRERHRTISYFSSTDWSGITCWKFTPLQLHPEGGTAHVTHNSYKLLYSHFRPVDHLEHGFVCLILRHLESFLFPFKSVCTFNCFQLFFFFVDIYAGWSLTNWSQSSVRKQVFEIAHNFIR